MPVELLKYVKDAGPWAVAVLLLAIFWRWSPVLIQILQESRRRRRIEQAKLVQSDRRDERRRRESLNPPTQLRAASKMPSIDLAPPPRGEFDDRPTTDIKEILDEILQEETKPEPKRSRGFRPPTRGEHHDGEG